MKKNFWLIVAATISTSVLAQDASNSTPAFQAPPPPPPAQTMTAPPADQPAPAIEASTNTPANPPAHKPKTTKTAKKKTTKKAVAHKAAPELKTVPLVAGPAVVSANHVNVRSKAGLVGEILTRMTNGEPVMVIDEVQLKKSGADEPSAWAKVALPADAHVWLKSSYLDTNNAVTARKLKLRAGPGENFGVVGIVDRGDVVQPIGTKEDWTQIQAPTNAYAFIAAEYLKQEEGATVATTAPEAPATPETPATPGTVAETPAVAPPATETPGMPATTNGATDTNPAPVMGEAPPTTPAVEEPPPRRIVQHEGIVRGSFSVQAPTRFALISPDNHQIINYLYTPTSNLDISRYKGMHIIVTGEEGLDDRWRNTPVITIQKIQVLD